MKVDIKNVEKTQGLVFKKKFYGVETKVTFSEVELAIIKERNLGSTIVIKRSFSADFDLEKEATKGIVRNIATAVFKGTDALIPHLTINKLVKGPDTHYFFSIDEVKTYIVQLRTQLAALKDMIEMNERPADDESFEL